MPSPIRVSGILGEVQENPTENTVLDRLKDISTNISSGQSDALTDSELRAAAVPVSAASLPLPTGAATLAKQNAIAGLVTDAFDYIALTYVAGGSDGEGEVETATFKAGGSGGTTVATLTLAYDASDRLSSVTKT